MQVSVLLPIFGRSTRIGHEPDHLTTARTNPGREDDQRLRWSSSWWSPPPESNRRPHPYHGSGAHRRQPAFSQVAAHRRWRSYGPVLLGGPAGRGGGARHLLIWPHRRLVYASSADRQRERLAVDVLVKAVSIGTLIWLQRRGCTALEHVEAVDVVGLPDVDAWPDVTVVGPAHVAEE